jgi:hypothetical protein
MQGSSRHRDTLHRFVVWSEDLPSPHFGRVPAHPPRRNRRVRTRYDVWRLPLWCHVIPFSRRPPPPSRANSRRPPGWFRPKKSHPSARRPHHLEPRRRHHCLHLPHLKTLGHLPTLHKHLSGPTSSQMAPVKKSKSSKTSESINSKLQLVVKSGKVGPWSLLFVQCCRKTPIKSNPCHPSSSVHPWLQADSQAAALRQGLVSFTLPPFSSTLQNQKPCR